LKRFHRYAGFWSKVICCGLLSVSTIGNEVFEWNALMIDAIRADNTGPTLSTRNLAILHLAIFDAVNSITRSCQPYQTQVEAPLECSPSAAAAAAGHEVMNALYPGFSARSDQLLATFLERSPPNLALTNGISLGLEVAKAALNNRADDGATTDVPYIPSDEPGQWRRTPPLLRPPLTPQWRYVDLFALPEFQSFLPASPPALGSAEYALALNEVKALGSRESSVRTAEQSKIAVFWSDFSYTSMPPGHWHLITAEIARSRALTLPESARLFALISIAQADAAIVCWEAKFRYNLWRPITAIQRAAEDGNSLTEAVPEWNSYLNAPPFPGYISGHSTFSKATTEVIAAFFGTDSIGFDATSDSLPGVVRHFDSLSACADEIGMSRIYGGIHFSFDNIEGKRCGQMIGGFVSANFLLPVEHLPFLVVESVANEMARLRLHAEIGQTVLLQKTSDFKEWSNVSTNAGTIGGTLISQPSAGVAFFRLQVLP
jgi:hypothetical protein